MADRLSGHRGLAPRLASTWRSLRPFARPHRRWLWQGSAAAVGVVLARLAFPWPLRGVMELVLPDGDRGVVLDVVLGRQQPLLWLGVAFVLIALAQGAAEYAQRVSYARFAIGLVHDARGTALRRLLTDEERARRARTGDVIARTTADAARLKAGVKGGLIHVSQNAVYVLGVTVVLVVVDPLLGLVFLTGAAVTFVVGYLGAVRIGRVARRHRRKEGRFADTLHEALAAGGDTKSIGQANRKSGHAAVQSNRLEGLTTWTAHGVLALSASVVAYLGLHGVSTGRLQAGQLFLVLVYVMLAHVSTVRLVRYTARLGKIMSNAERLAKLVGPPTEEPVTAGSHSPVLTER